MTAEVVKQPKLYRIAQRWRAECEECPVDSFDDQPQRGHWGGYPYRQRQDAQRAAERHDRERHNG